MSKKPITVSKLFVYVRVTRGLPLPHDTRISDLCAYLVTTAARRRFTRNGFSNLMRRLNQDLLTDHPYVRELLDWPTTDEDEFMDYIETVYIVPRHKKWRKTDLLWDPKKHGSCILSNEKLFGKGINGNVGY